MASSWHLLYSSLYLWSKSHLVNIALSYLEDRADIAYLIEAQTLFLDHNFTKYVNRVPASIKIRYNKDNKIFTEKYILREASRLFVLDKLYRRQKHQFLAP